MNEGYIKAHRSLLDSMVFQSEGLLKVWMWCMLRATYKERWVPVITGKGFTEVHLLPGQFIYGRESASLQLRMKPSTVHDRIQKLKSHQNIDIQTNSHYSIITVLNWDKYQGEDDEEQQAKQQPSDTQATGKQQPSDTNKKEKKVKRKNTIETPWPDDFVLTDHMRNLAAKYIPAEMIDLEWEVFKARCLSLNLKYVKWEQAWTTRYLNYAKFSGGNGGKPAVSNKAQEAHSCYMKCHGSCAARWDMHRDKESICHYCEKFETQRSKNA